MNRVVLLLTTIIVGCFIAGCGQSAPPPAQIQPARAAANATRGVAPTGGMAPNAVAAPPGEKLGDHRGGLDGGSIPGMPGRRSGG